MFFADIVDGVDCKFEGAESRKISIEGSWEYRKNWTCKAGFGFCVVNLILSFQGENGVLELFIEGDFADTFEVSPSVVENSAQFVVSVKNSKKIDYEELQTIEFKVGFHLTFIRELAKFE